MSLLGTTWAIYVTKHLVLGWLFCKLVCRGMDPLLDPKAYVCSKETPLCSLFRNFPQILL